jgi:trehalose/maltose transport system substrate-binding protein
VVQLTMMASGESSFDLDFNKRQLDAYTRRSGVQVRNIAAYDDMNTRLELFQQLFRERSPQPDICEIDNIWPGLLADDLLDLRPYLDEELTAFDSKLLAAFTVDGKLLALPVTMDAGMLYYRTDLLQKYGFHGPPETWDELTKMAGVIQAGERKAGNKNFWGYSWQGTNGEALTCNAAEWQAAEGSGMVGADHTIDVANQGSRCALARAVSWVGNISPPSVIEYDEEDSQNLWLNGDAAFLRSWADAYPASLRAPLVKGKFGVAIMPAGSKSRGWVFGAMAIGVSAYSLHPTAAIRAVRFLVSAEVQRQRALQVGQIPTRSDLLKDQDLLLNTPFHGELGERWREGLVLRPAMSVGKKYDAVSRAYSDAVHRVLERKESVDAALTGLQGELMRITGFPAGSDAETRRRAGN